MLEIGTVLQDRFLIEGKIGVGGMGAVYLATDQKFGSRVAVKETTYDTPELAQAFEREARLLNSLHHPVLPHVSDIFSEGGRLMLVMEYIEGEDLSEPLKRGEKLEIDSVVRWTFELLDALDYLHSQDPPIIHRDIKPNNLKVTPRGNVVLLDFGLAKETSGNTLGMLSVFGYSRRYSPLEQIEGTGTDVRSDIFALGATIFHLLTGEPPIDVLARASAIVAGRPDPLKLASELNPEVPVKFAALIKSAMSLNANDRFETAAAMRTALEHTVGRVATPDQERHEIGGAGAITVVAERPDPVHAIADDRTLAASRREAPRPALEPPVEKEPALPNTAVAAGVGGVEFRTYRNKSRRTLALVGLAVLALAGLAFGVYKSILPTPPSPETVVEASPTLPEGASASGIVDVTEESRTAEPPKTDERAELPERASDEKIVKSEPAAAPKRAESQPDPEPAVRAPQPERPRVVKQAPKRDRQPVYNDEPPVDAIEQIFTGGRPRAREISEEEFKRERRRIKRAIRRGEIPPW